MFQHQLNHAPNFLLPLALACLLKTSLSWNQVLHIQQHDAYYVVHLRLVLLPITLGLLVSYRVFNKALLRPWNHALLIAIFLLSFLGLVALFGASVAGETPIYYNVDGLNFSLARSGVMELLGLGLLVLALLVGVLHLLLFLVLCKK
jgi:hypothetical protein